MKRTLLQLDREPGGGKRRFSGAGAAIDIVASRNGDRAGAEHVGVEGRCACLRAGNGIKKCVQGSKMSVKSSQPIPFQEHVVATRAASRDQAERAYAYCFSILQVNQKDAGLFVT